MNSSLSSFFGTSGLACLSDLETGRCRELLRLLEAIDAEFLSREQDFRSREYSWPRRPLQTWSRVWEYPFVYEHLTRRLGAHERQQLVVDLGSGVTFFPFACARLGASVVCTDIDPVCASDIPRAARVINQGSGRVSYRPIEAGRLPFADQEVDVLYSISVLEHVEGPESLIQEIHRVLKPDGLCLLTIDLDLRGDSQIGPVEYARLKETVSRHFECKGPVRVSHPLDYLTSVGGPFPVVGSGLMPRLRWLIRQWLLGPISGQAPRPFVPFLLAVEGLALRPLSERT